MENFTFYNPTRLIFGRDQVQALQTELPKYGKNILVVYGGGSVKKSGLYDNVMNQLKQLDVNVFELPGVEPNPRLSTVHKGVDICKNENIDFLLAVGGGSASTARRRLRPVRSMTATHGTSSRTKSKQPTPCRLAPS